MRGRGGGYFNRVIKYKLSQSRDRSVGIATRLWAGRLGF
jgi:hypothetical protein